MLSLTINLYFILLAVILNSGVISHGAVQLADELLLALSLGIIYSKNLRPKLPRANLAALRKFRESILIYSTYAFALSIASPFGLNPLLSTIQSFINIKFAIISLAGAIISRNSVSVRRARTLFTTAIALFTAGLLINLIVGEEWNLFFSPNDEVLYRFDLIRPIGWFGHPSQNGYFVGLFGATTAFLWSKSSKTKKPRLARAFWLFFVTNTVLTALINVRKSLFALLIFAISTTGGISKLSRLTILIALALGMAVGTYIAKDTALVVETLNDFGNMLHNDNEDYIRGLMIFNGWRLFLEFFPFGVGGGTFGTVLSQFNSLSVYEYVGLNMNLIYNQNDRLEGVYDSGFFSMLAENGFIGMLLLFLVIKRFYDSISTLIPFTALPIVKIIIGYAILLSLTEPAWQNGLFSAFFALNIIYASTSIGTISSRSHRNLVVNP